MIGEKGIGDAGMTDSRAVAGTGTWPCAAAAAWLGEATLPLAGPGRALAPSLGIVIDSLRAGRRPTAGDASPPPGS